MQSYLWNSLANQWFETTDYHYVHVTYEKALYTVGE